MTDDNGSGSNNTPHIYQIYLSSQLHDAECDLRKISSLINEQQQKKKTLPTSKPEENTTVSSNKNDDNGMEITTKKRTTAKALLQELSFLQTDIENLSIKHDYISSIKNDNDFSIDFLTQDEDEVSQKINALVKQCTHLGRVLLHHTPPPPSFNDSKPTKTTTNVYDVLLQRYESFHKYARAVCITELRKTLRTVHHYPSPHGCFMIKIALEDVLRNIMICKGGGGGDAQEEGFGVGGGGSGNSNIGFLAKYLIELQVVNDLLEDHLSQHGIISNQNNNCDKNPSNVRIDVMDELCRPIVERVRYHFLNQEQQQSPDASSSPVCVTSQRIDKLPEWLFGYLRNDILECSSTDKQQEVKQYKNEEQGLGIGVYELVQECIRPFISIVSTNVAESLTATSFDGSVGENDNYDNNNSGMTRMIHAPWYYGEATAYLLREVIYLCRHVLRSRRFFQHPMIVGGGPSFHQGGAEKKKKSYNPLLLCNAIGQILLFDDFVADLLDGDNEVIVGGMMNNLEGGGGSRRQLQQQYIITPPRLLDVFITSNAVLFECWMNIDREYAMSALVSAASSSSFSSSQDEKYLPKESNDSDVTDFASVNFLDISPSFMPPTAEVFISLVQSLRAKLDATSNAIARREYVASVIIPVCTHFMDVMHETASTLRNILLTKKRSSSSRGKTILPGDEDLRRNMLGWIEVICGTHLASVALLGDEVIEDNKYNDNTGEEEENNGGDLNRVGRSLSRLRDAMVDECCSSIVETILMERAKLAGYLMRCPFVLSSHDESNISTGVDSHRAVSPDLIDSIQILSVVVRICDKVSRQMESTMNTEEDDNIEDDIHPQQYHRVIDLIERCPQSIKSNLAERLEEKMLEVALDIHGMTPEIGWGGAQQFCYDTFELAHIFEVDKKKKKAISLPFSSKQSPSQRKYFCRLVDAVSLMAMESTKFASLREVLHGLVRPDGIGMGAEYDVNGDDDFADSELMILHYEDFNADGTVLDEAMSMLSAKGLVFLGLDDVISIMNRRKL